MLFAAVAQRRSFRAAARDLGLSVSALSHAINGLETALGLRLLDRTTRSVAPTEAGLRLLEGLTPALAAIDEAVETAGQTAAGLSGTIRLTVPRSAAELVLMPIVAGFLSAYPAVAIEMLVEDGLTDIVASGFDAGVRFGETLEQDMIAVPIGRPMRAAIVASPAYLQDRPIPLEPADLRNHRCIGRRFAGGATYRWDFTKDGAALQVAIEGCLTLNDDALTVQAALEGIGIGFAFEAAVEPYLSDGRLVRVLEDWCPEEPGFHLYYTSKRLMRPALRAFIDFARRKAIGPP